MRDSLAQRSHLGARGRPEADLRPPGKTENGRGQEDREAPMADRYGAWQRAPAASGILLPARQPALRWLPATQRRKGLGISSTNQRN